MCSRSSKLSSIAGISDSLVLLQALAPAVTEGSCVVSEDPCMRSLSKGISSRDHTNQCSCMKPCMQFKHCTSCVYMYTRASHAAPTTQCKLAIGSICMGMDAWLTQMQSSGLSPVPAWSRPLTAGSGTYRAWRARPGQPQPLQLLRRRLNSAAARFFLVARLSWHVLRRFDLRLPQRLSRCLRGRPSVSMNLVAGAVTKL